MNHIVGLTSAGRVAPNLPLPCLVVATSAIRDEGTSYHYMTPAREVACPSPIVPILERELIATGWPVRSGRVWTTDAPYGETKSQLNKWADEEHSQSRCRRRRSLRLARREKPPSPALPWLATPSTIQENSSIQVRKKMGFVSSKEYFEQSDISSRVLHDQLTTKLAGRVARCTALLGKDLRLATGPFGGKGHTGNMSRSVTNATRAVL